MGIFDPEIASLVGCLESDGFTDGAPVSAHQDRAMARSANRLKTKAQPLFNLVWPVTVYGDVGTTLFSGLAPVRWTRIMCPTPVKKRIGLIQATIWLRANLSSSAKIDVFIGSLARPFFDGVVADTTMTGSGSWTNYSITDVPILPGDTEEIELWIRATEQGAAMNTGTYGTPADSSGGGDFDIEDSLRAMSWSTAAWNLSGGGATNSPAAGGHTVVFLNDNGDPIAAPRDIVANGSTRIEFHPPLSVSEMQAAERFEEFEIYGGAQNSFAICNFGAMAQENTTLRLITPYSVHPGAPVTGEAYAQILDTGLDHLDTQSRALGYQTYSVINAGLTPFVDTTSANDWIDVAYFEGIVLPLVAHSVKAVMYYRRANVEPAQVFLRVIADSGGTITADSGSPDIGDTASEPPNGYADPPTGEFASQSAWTPGDPSLGAMIAEVTLDNARVSSGIGTRNVRVQAFCASAASGQALRPSLVMAWWEA